MAKFIARLLPLLLLGQILSGGATAQQRDRGPDLRLGDAVVTGFSGIVAPNLSQRRPPGKSAIDLTFINPEGPSARIVDLSKPGMVWDGTVLPAPKPFDVLAKDVGQVFGVALDDAPQPNIYLAATSAFGLNIVARGRDGQPERRKKGGPGVGWMKGQFGLDLQGGPGAIYKVDGRTGVPTLFANVTLDGVPNPGPGLGNLAYDSAHKQLFVSDLYTGMIHRFDLDGKELDRYDHGVTGLTAAKLAPVPFDPRNRPNIASDRFDSEKPETWGFAPAARRVWGLAVHEGRLYYSVTSGPQIWSIGLARDGRFANDPRWELDVPAQAGPLPISDIAFSNRGAMILAQRALIAGSYDYSAFTRPGEPQVFRIWLKGPKDPPSPGRWKLVPEEYAVGFAGNYRNTNGGVALGYGYGRDGNLSTTACEFSLWTTGQNLRNAPALRGRLDPGGPLVVHGIQGVPASPVRDINTPPWLSYTVGYGDRADDPRAAGHLGSVRIYSKPCNAMAVFGGPGYPVSPPYIVTTTVVVPTCVGSNCPPPPPPQTDIGIAKIGEVNLANPDGPYNFTIGVRNLAGPINNATPLTVTDVVPAGMTFTSITPTNFTCLPVAPVSGGTTLTCTYNGPFPIATNQILGSVEIVADGGNGPYTNCASLGQTDSDASNDKACATVQKDYGNLTVVKEVENNTQPQVSTVGLVYPVTVTCGSTVTNLSLIDGMPQTVGPIPFNTTCSVVEGTPPMPSGACPAGQLTWTKSKIPQDDVQIVSGVNATVRVHNKLDCAPSDGGGDGSLVVTKTVINKVIGAPFPTGLTYPVTVTCGSMVTPLTLSENVPQTVSNIPTPASCHVQEGTMPTVNLPCAMMGDVPTWTIDYLPTQDISVTGANTPVTVQNTLECKPPGSTGFKLTVNKVVTNRTNPQIPVIGTVFAISTSCALGMSPAVVTPMPLTDGTSQTVSGLANNTTCNISETLPPPPVTTFISCLPHFSPVWSTLPVAPVTINNADATATVQNFLDCVPDGGGDNAYILVKKQVVSNVQGYAAPAAIYPVNVTCNGTTTTLNLSSDGTPQSVGGLAINTQCQVSEPAVTSNACPTGMTTVWGPIGYSTSTPTAAMPGPTVTVTNTFNCIQGGGGNGQLVLTKIVSNKTQGAVQTNGLTYPTSVSCASGMSPAVVTNLSLSENIPQTVSNIAPNSSCTITETPPTVTGVCADQTQVPTWTLPPQLSIASPVPVNGTTVNVTVTNTLLCAAGMGSGGNGALGSLVVTKNVVNNTPGAVSNTSYKVNVSCQLGSASPTITQLTLVKDVPQTIDNIAVGSNCSVTETEVLQLPPGNVCFNIGLPGRPYPAWTTTVTPSPAQVNGPGTAVTVLNSLDCVPVSGNTDRGYVILRKIIQNNAGANLSSTTFPITLTCGNTTQTFNLSSSLLQQTMFSIPVNTACSASETLPPPPATGTCDQGKVPTWVNSPSYSDASVTVVNPFGPTLTVTNTLNCEPRGSHRSGGGPGSLVVTKTVVNNTGASVAGMTFPAVFSCGGSQSGSFAIEYLTLSDGSSQTVSNLALGAGCTISSETFPPVSPSACTQPGQVPRWGIARTSGFATVGVDSTLAIVNTLSCQSAQAITAPLQCTAPQVPNASGTACVCPTGMFLIAGRGCVTPPACQPPMVVGAVPGQCVCPKGMTQTGGGCVAEPACKAPMVAGAAPGQCVCPAGTVKRGERCVETVVCRSPAKLNGRGTACTCPKGMTLKGNTCVEPERKRPAINGDDVIRALPGLIGPGGFGGGGRSGGGAGGGNGGGGGYKPPKP